VGNWQGAWGGEAAALFKRNIDMRVVVYPINTASDPDHYKVYFSLAPHPNHGKPKSFNTVLAKKESATQLLFNDAGQGHYQLQLDKGVLMGQYHLAEGEINNIQLYKVPNGGLLKVKGDRGNIWAILAGLTVDDFGGLLGYVVLWDALFQSSLYFITGGLVFFVLHKLLKKRMSARKIQGQWPSWTQLRTELWYSFTTLCIFGLSGSALIYSIYTGNTLMYDKINEMGGLYFLFSLVVIFLLHDTYFYWWHRIMHHRALFPYFHRGHHSSKSPTLWSTWAFMPLEAVIQAAFVPLVVYVLPLHYYVVAIFYIGMFVRSLIGHTGFEIYPKIVVKSRWLNWMANVSHHDMHHHYFHYNFGLYFTFWDRLMGTLHPEYEARVEALLDRQQKMT
jgi:sterol desaturase/sphingolipid hydroxylase (fatty acid hydroxylase superfamily)